MSESDSKVQERSPVLSKKPLEADLDGVHYTLRRETTGEEYLLIRDESIGTKDGITRLDTSRYEHANLRVRLLREGEPLEDDILKKLPRTHYQTLATLATQIDNEESGIVSDFLSGLMGEFPAYRSALAKLSDSRQSGSERTSKSNTSDKRN